MAEGYIYCFSNPSMPGIVKVGMTLRTPDIRLGEANSSDTWRPPTPYINQFAKSVKNPKDKEGSLHFLLEKYTERINPRREFFRTSPEDVRKFFELIDGEWWEQKADEEKTEEERTGDGDEGEEDDDLPVAETPKGCRDMTKCFTHGQQIRHVISRVGKPPLIWIGTYDSARNGVVCNGTFYANLTSFATAHILQDFNPDRKTTRDGWKNCECEMDGKWVSTFTLPM